MEDYYTFELSDNVTRTPIEYKNRYGITLAVQRWEDVDNGEAEYNPSFPEEIAQTVPEGLDPISEEFFRYYGLERGHHTNACGGFTTTSNMSMINFSLLDHVDTISPRPVLFIMGENAHSRYFSVNVYEAATEPKALYVVPDAEHMDLYDDINKIPFDKLETFLRMQCSKLAVKSLHGSSLSNYYIKGEKQWIDLLFSATC